MILGPSFYKFLSLKLYSVLEDIGATTESRELFQLRSTASVVSNQEDLCLGKNILGFSEHVFGSAFEGTRTAGLNSDIDYVTIADRLPVKTEVADAPQGQSLLIVENERYPGYVKLQLVQNGKPVYEESSADDINDSGHVFTRKLDKHNRTVLGLPKYLKLSDSNRTGPAFSSRLPKDSHLAPTDIVIALNCVDYPKCAADFITRERKYNWPSATTLQACRNMGCIFVAKGHPKSDEQDLEWRMSLSRQERCLLCQFSSVQLKCLVMLKIIKKTILSHFIGEETLTSYHCKTCLLYVIENTPNEIWIPENLFACIDACLRQLLYWVESGFCPNYFIPDENMFEGRISEDLLPKLCSVLKILISSNSKYMVHIKCDNLGRRLRHALFGPRVGSSDGITLRTKDDFRLELHCHILSVTLHFREVVIRNCFNENIEVFIKALLDKRAKYHEIKSEATRETQTVLSLALPYIDVCIISNLIVHEKRQNCGEKRMWQYLTSPLWGSLANKYDNVTFKLKQACLMHRLGYYESSLDILTSVEARMGHMYSVCSCDEVPVFPNRMTPELCVNSEETEFLNNCLAPCVIFLPTEKELTPAPLLCECKRLICDEAQGAGDEQKRYSYNWAVVDAKILMYFLFFVNHFRLGLYDFAAADADDMANLLSNSEISHKETALNLLAWIMSYFGNTKDAAKCLKESLNTKPKYNAAETLLMECWYNGEKKHFYEFIAYMARNGQIIMF